MSKDPAFLWYPNDYLGGTMGMSQEQKGAYVDLLMMQFNQGHMTDDMIGQVAGQNWDRLKVKFKQDEKGLWFNERLEVEKKKRQTFVNSRRNNLSGKNQYSKKNTSTRGHKTSRKENENEDVNVIVNEYNNGVREFYQNQFLLARGDIDVKARTGYFRFVGTIFCEGEYKNSIDEPADHILKLKTQLAYQEYKTLAGEAKKRQVSLMDMLNDMINTKKYTKDKKSIYLTLLSWVKKHDIKGSNH